LAFFVAGGASGVCHGLSLVQRIYRMEDGPQLCHWVESIILRRGHAFHFLSFRTSNLRPMTSFNELGKQFQQYRCDCRACSGVAATNSIKCPACSLCISSQENDLIQYGAFVVPHLEQFAEFGASQTFGGSVHVLVSGISVLMSLGTSRLDSIHIRSPCTFRCKHGCILYRGRVPISGVS
jgi:hypothetical protein